MAGLLGNMFGGSQGGLLGNPDQMPQVPFRQNPVVTAIGSSLLAGPGMSGRYDMSSVGPALVAKTAMQGGMQKQKDAAAQKAKVSEAWNAVIRAKSTGQPPPPEAMSVLVESNPAIAGKYFEGMMPSAPKPTDDITEWNAAKEEGYTGTLQDWIIDQKRAGATTVNTGDAPGAAFYKKLDEGSAGMFTTLYDEGVKANNAIIKIDRLDDLLSKVPTGAEATVKQIAGNWGIPTEGLSEIQAAQALINQLVPSQRPVGSGPMSDADLELIKQSMPRIINQPGGNKLIIETLRGINEYTRQQGIIAAKVQTRELTPQQGYEALAQLENPLAKFSSGPTASPDSGTVGWEEYFK